VHVQGNKAKSGNGEYGADNFLKVHDGLLVVISRFLEGCWAWRTLAGRVI
jgi:hypothetical protein